MTEGTPALSEEVSDPGSADGERTGSGPIAVLVGVPGSGKSTIGRALAAALGVEFRDTDTDVEVDTGRSIADIFVQSGEPEFRRLEEAAVAEALTDHRGVLALGGGAVTSAPTRELLLDALQDAQAAGINTVMLNTQVNNQRAQQFLPKAHMMSRLMSKFPFVRAVFISGSLSKNVMPDGGDIDYFIVTQPGRLWIARTLLVLFKKLFLFNSHKYFCVNYFVDQNHLEIEEKNRFTATEIITLLPTYGQQYYQQFFAANTWAKKYYPCFPERAVTEIPVHQSGWVQQTGEFFFKEKTGDWVDRFFMKKTLNYWHRKFENFDKDKFAIALKSRPYVSKHHPLDFQTRVLAEYQNRMDLFAEKHQVQFHTKFP